MKHDVNHAPPVVQTDKDGALGWALSRLKDWSREKSMWPATFGLACCAIEMMAAAAGKYDIARFGMEIYDQMPEPKWVIAMGDCASCGGIFNNYAIVQGVDKIVPVDVYVPGCPPRPEMLIHAVMMLQDKVMKESIRDRRDAPDEEAREAMPPGTLPVTDGSTLREGETGTPPPYTIAS